MNDHRTPGEQLAVLVGPDTARALIQAGWDALRSTAGARPDLVHPGVADYVATVVALGVAPTLLAVGRRQAADAIRAGRVKCYEIAGLNRADWAEAYEECERLAEAAPAEPVEDTQGSTNG